MEKNIEGLHLELKSFILTWYVDYILSFHLFLIPISLLPSVSLSTPPVRERMTEWAGDWHFLIELHPTNGVNQGPTGRKKKSFSDRGVSKIVRPPWQQIHSSKKKKKSEGERVKENSEPWHKV